MKVKNLISQLAKLDPEQAILFQYFTAEHAKLSEAEFSKLSEWLMSFSEFGDDASDSFSGWIAFAQDTAPEEEE